MEHKYTKKEIERILNQDLDIPDKVQDKIHAAYDELGIDTKITMKYTKRHRVWVAAGIAAALLVGTSTVALAASQVLSGAWVEKDKSVQYDYKVDNKMKAHAIKVTPTYMPDGYVNANPNYPDSAKQQWNNPNNGGEISIMSYNAADLDSMKRVGNSPLAKYTKEQHVKDTDINGDKTDAFEEDSFYVDSDKKTNSVYMFNEEYGYGVEVWSSSNLSTDEILKIAKGLKIDVLDTIVPYVSDEIITKEKGDPNDRSKEAKAYAAGVPDSKVFDIGQQIANPLYDKNNTEITKSEDDIRFTVEDIQIKDSLPLKDYPVQNFVKDYNKDIAPWINPDGTLKPHARYKDNIDSKGAFDKKETLERNVKSKFVVVKMKVKNFSDTQSKMNKETGVEMDPATFTLLPKKGGGYAYPDYWLERANENYGLQSDGFPIYFDKIYHTDGIKRQMVGLYRPLAAGEELEYTLAYVVDEDQINNMYLRFFYENRADSCYVKVVK